MRNLKTKDIESELKPLIPRIRRLPTKLLTEDVQQPIKESGESSNQPINESGQPLKRPKESSDNIKLDESHPRFGPLYTVKQEQVDAIKDKAWEHVLRKSSGEWEATMEIYLDAVRKVEREARDMYAGKVSGIGSKFRWMMIKDGCFFLQLALLILGCSQQLDYSQNDPIFGKLQRKNEVKKWIEAMFYSGNQIPLVVLREFMDQEFFQKVIAKAKWDPPPSGLCKMALYQVLVLPVLRRNQERLVVFMGRGNDDAEQQQQLCDLLHACQSLVMGPAATQEEDPHRADDDEIDLEANEDEAEDYERIFPTPLDDEDEDHDDHETSPGDIGNRIRNILNAMGVPNAVDNRTRIFPSATELKRQGIRIKKLKSGGARGIHYKAYYFWAYLYLPALPLDGNAEVILRNLKNYDNFQQQQSGQNGGEVSSYLRFMSDLIQTTRDTKLLQSKDIVQGKSDDVEKLPAMLNRLSSEDIRLTQELRLLRRQIRDYSSPWIHYKGVINLVVFLTLLQTLFALLAYFRPPKQN